MKYLRFALVSVVVVVLTFLFVEIAMTMFDPILFKGFFEYDPDLGFKARGHFAGTNEFGFNDRDRSEKPAPGVRRIMILGDSFNWTGKLECSYPGMMDKSFQDENSHVEILNVGYPATGTPEEFAILKKFGMRSNPDMVVLAFFLGNDFSEADLRFKRIIVNSMFMQIGVEEEHKFLGYPIVMKSRLLEFAQNYWKIRKSLKAIHDEDRARKAHANFQCSDAMPEYSDEGYSDMARAKFDVWKFNNPYAETLRVNVDNTVHEMAKYLRERKIEFRALILPDEFQVDLGVRRKYLAMNGIKEGDIDWFKTQRWIRETFEREKIPYLDFTDDFMKSPKSLYVPRNTHWNLAGTRFVAEKVHAWLKEANGHSLAAER